MIDDDEEPQVSVVKINALTVPEEMREVLEKRFAGQAGMVESADGFEHFELLRPVEGTDRYLVYTRWRSIEDFERWMATQGPGHGQGRGQGGGGPASSGAEQWSFEVIESAAPKS